MVRDEATRYEQFCQFKQQVRGSDSHLIVGIDVAKDQHHAFFGRPTGRTLLRRLIFDNSRDGFEQLTTRAEQLRRQHGLSQVVYAVEPTGNYHKPLAHWLQSHDQMLVLVSNKAIAENRQTLDGRWDKNDTKDSANVADLVCQGKCQFFEKMDEEARFEAKMIAGRMKNQREKVKETEAHIEAVCRRFKVK